MSFKDFFREDSKLSSQRLNTFILIITAVLLSILSGYLVFTGKLITDLTYLIATLLGFGLGSKVASKIAEKNAEIKINQEEHNNENKQQQ